MALSLVVLSLVVLALVRPSPSAAQDCDAGTSRAVREVTPAAGATAVTIDAPIRLRYSAGYFGPDGPGDDPATLVTLVRCGTCATRCSIDEGQPVAGDVSVSGDLLTFVPLANLQPSSGYAGVASAVDGDFEFSFCTGTRTDTMPPTRPSISSQSSTEVSDGSCDGGGAGYRIGVFVTPSTDDGPGGSIEYLLFMTRGPNLTEPVLVNRVRNFSTTSDITMSFRIDRDAASLPMCVSVIAVDGVGNASMESETRCFDPLTQVTFEGCAAMPGLSRHGGALGLVLLGGLARRARRRRRR